MASQSRSRSLFKPRRFETRCAPPFWARTGHLQTIVGHLWPSPAIDRKPSAEWRIRLEDGDHLIGEFYASPTPVDHDRAQTVVYLFHGLGGHANADYMRRTARQALALGFSVVLMNHRGCGAGRGLAREIYHSGRADDLASVLHRGRAELPKHRHVMIGFSLSGNALLLLLSRDRAADGANDWPDAAIAVNAPINLEAAARRLRRGLNRVYDRRFVRLCLEHALAAGHSVALAPRATLHDFDAVYTGPRSGFGTRENYYAQCSTHARLDRIQVPTVVLTAADDPFVDVADYERARLSEQVSLHIEARGGHMGYLAGWRGRRWLDEALTHYLRELADGHAV